MSVASDKPSSSCRFRQSKRCRRVLSLSFFGATAGRHRCPPRGFPPGRTLFRLLLDHERKLVDESLEKLPDESCDAFEHSLSRESVTDRGAAVVQRSASVRSVITIAAAALRTHIRCCYVVVQRVASTIVMHAIFISLSTTSLWLFATFF